MLRLPDRRYESRVFGVAFDEYRIAAEEGLGEPCIGQLQRLQVLLLFRGEVDFRERVLPG